MCEEVHQPPHSLCQSVVQTFPAIDLPQHPNYCVSQPTPALELLPDAKKKTPAKPSEIDIVSLPLVTHLNFSPEKKSRKVRR